ncbi:MAG TPA: ATP-binding protein [Kofleriaceae bacterium]|nr:ATP-binding protein [Kofleriaceae bacterium]
MFEGSGAAAPGRGSGRALHSVQFYDTDEFLYQRVAEHLAAGLTAGEPVAVIAAPGHRRGIAQQLEAGGIDLEAMVADGRAAVLDAQETLTELMSGDLPDRERFRARVVGILAATGAGAAGAPVRIYGEMVDVLWRSGRRAAALRLEELWSELAEVYRFSLLCGYASDGFHRDHGLSAVCALHSHVMPPEANAALNGEGHETWRLLSEISRRSAAEAAARAARDDLEELLDDAPVPIHSVDASGKILYANRAELEMLGYTADEYIGHPVSEFHVDAPVLDDMLERLSRGETLHDREVELLAKDGSIRHVLVSSKMTFKDGKQVATRCFSRDITQRKQAEEERDKVIADLSRTVRLNDMFAGILGHDLRGPLSTIVMAGQLLLGQTQDARGVRTIQRILSSAGRMQQMIGQLLDFARARMDGGIELERAPTDISDIARDVIEEVRFTRPEWQIEVEAHGDLRGQLDGPRLSQVFSNLVGNAVQHGSAERPLQVTIDGRDREAIRVAIENAGAIAPELLPNLFSPFRGSQTRVRGQGLGLGLFITDHIVRAHGGQIAVDSAESSTVFRFDLPRHSETAAVATFDAHEPEPGSGPAPGMDNFGLSDPAMRVGALAEAAEKRLVQEATRQHEERFRLLVESVKDYAIFMLDPDGHVATWNSGAQRIKGYTADEIIGRHFSAFYPEHEIRAGKTEYELAAAQRDGRFEDEGWRIRKDGTKFWANVVITALRDRSGLLVGYAKVTRDLTERRKVEQERIALAQATEAVRLRDEFLSLASHELKTPLTVLQLQLEALRDRIDVSDRGVLSKLERSMRAGSRLAELVEMLLDVSRIATGRFALNLERADVADIVESAVDRMQDAAEVAGCGLSVTAEHAIGRWDRSRLDQLISSLISNAIRYAAGTPIAIGVTREQGDVVIAVRDRGPGIPTEQLVRIFGRFERGASMRHFGGLGLGLYLVRQIAEAHGGTATASNASGGGACITVRLPIISPDDAVA